MFSDARVEDDNFAIFGNRDHHSHFRVHFVRSRDFHSLLGVFFVTTQKKPVGTFDEAMKEKNKNKSLQKQEKKIEWKRDESK